MLKLATFRGVSSEGEPLVQVFHKGDSVSKLAGAMMPEIQHWMDQYQPEPGKIAVLVNAMGASEYWGQNINGDLFPEGALVHDCRNHPSTQHPVDDFTGKVIPAYGYPTFYQAHPFVHHKNKDPNRAFGKVVFATWNPRMHRVELIIVLDQDLALQHGAAHVVDRILAGEFPDVSMGCKVPYDVCTICGHKSRTRKDYCNCIRFIGMNKILDDGRQIGVINLHPRFFDISFVFIGADKTAKVMMKLGSGLWVPQSVLDAEMVYGTSEDDGELVKAASDDSNSMSPSNLVFSSDPEQVGENSKSLKDILMERLSSDGESVVSMDKVAPPPPETYFGRTDNQGNLGNRAVMDGNLKTNADDDDEGQNPLYPGRGKEASAPLFALLGGGLGAGAGALYNEKDRLKGALIGGGVGALAGTGAGLLGRSITGPNIRARLLAPNAKIEEAQGKFDKLKAVLQKAKAERDIIFSKGTPTGAEAIALKAAQEKALKAERAMKAVADSVAKPMMEHAEFLQKSKPFMDKLPTITGGAMAGAAGLGTGSMASQYFGKESSADEGGSTPSEERVAHFLKLNPNPSDGQLHEWAEGHGFNVHEAERMIYRLATAHVKEGAVKVGPPPKPNRKEYPFVGSINFRGLMIHVENDAGDVREGTGPGGKKWRTVMKNPYGEFMGTRGVDKDKLDVYVGPNRKAANVYIVHQNHTKGPKAGKYDEDKVMVGFDSAEAAKKAYLAHYDSPKFFRSITTMAFPLFKRAIMKKEVHGEKVASALVNALEKNASELQLEDLFPSAAGGQARLRQRVWKDLEGNSHTQTGPTKTKTAAKRKVAQPFTPAELLKVSNDPKTASHLKWADIIKEIGPSKAVGKVSPLLSSTEPEIPTDTLNAMGKEPLEQSLATPSLMGMVLKPQEFQRIMLSSMGKEPLADKLDDAGATFKPTEDSVPPCGGMGPGDLSGRILKALLPLLQEKSYFGPVAKKRIIQITISKPGPAEPGTEVDSPLLSKVSAAYTWYRSEQLKLAAQAPRILSDHPSLRAEIYGLDDADLFGKTASKMINPKTLAVVAGAVPLTLMYAAHLRDEKAKGKSLNMIQNLAAEHPWLTTIGTAAGLREIMKSPQAQQAVEEIFSAGKRIWKGKGTPHVIV